MLEQPKRDWKSVRRRRNKQLNLRLSSQEYQQIKEDADRMEITIGAYIRKVVLNAPIPRQSKRPNIQVQKLGSLLGQIGKIGSNINQIAHAANANIPCEKSILENELNALKEIRRDIKKALGKKPK